MKVSYLPFAEFKRMLMEALRDEVVQEFVGAAVQARTCTGCGDLIQVGPVKDEDGDPWHQNCLDQERRDLAGKSEPEQGQPTSNPGSWPFAPGSQYPVTLGVTRLYLICHWCKGAIELGSQVGWTASGEPIHNGSCKEQLDRYPK